MRGLPTLVLSKSVHGEKLRTPNLSQQPVLGIKEIPRTGSCKPVRTGQIPSLVVAYNKITFCTCIFTKKISTNVLHAYARHA